MNTQVEEVTSVADIVKLVLAPILAVAGVVGFYYLSDQLQLLYRVLILVGVLASAVAVYFNTAKGRGLWEFVLESKQEFKRVVWPTRDEAVKTTLIVVAMVAGVGVMLWLLDMFLFWGVQLLMNLGG